MSKARKAHSNEIIDRRLRQYESSDSVDSMELIELHNELSRVERKWIEKNSSGNERSNPPPLANHEHINQRFERLARLIAVAVRRAPQGPERDALERITAALQSRSPLKK
jgi:hypothetical protein